MDLLDDNGDENLLTHIPVDDAPPHQVVPQMVCYALPLLVIDFTYNLLNIVSLKNFNSQ
jgi:hypothetical protein